MSKTIQILVFNLLLTLVLVLGFESANATHIVGGELTYRCLGNNSYEVTLTVRRDCENGADDAPFDDPAIIGIYDIFGALQVGIGETGTLRVPFMGSDTISDELTFDCGVLGGLVCVHEAVYRDTLYLEDNKIGYILAYQRCCRNVILNNIVDPLLTGATYFSRIEFNAIDDCNSQPTFNAWPEIYTCVNEDVDFDHSATDVDGDSLVYKLCTPFQGATKEHPMPDPPSTPPYEVLEWLPPYSLSNVMGGDPLRIDSRTGRLTGTPDMIGTFVVGVCVEEYKNGMLISTVRRDFEYNVRACTDPILVDFNVNNNDCDGDLIVNFDNTTIGANSYQWYFDYPNTDPAFSSTEEDPTFEYPVPGRYKVRLEASRDSDGCTAIEEKTIVVSNIPLIADFEAIVESCDLTNSIRLNDLSIDTTGISRPVSWAWTIELSNSTLNLNGESVVFEAGDEDFVNITLEVSSDAGCVSTISRIVNVGDLFPDPDLDFGLLGCEPDYIVAVRLVEGNDLMVDSIFWTQNDNGQITGSTAGDSISITSDLTDFEITAVIYYNNGCIKEVTRTITEDDILPKLTVSDDLQDMCIGNDTVTVNLTQDIMGGSLIGEVSEFNWIINGQSVSDEEELTIELFGDSTLQIILDAFFNGCIFSDTLDLQTTGEADLDISENVDCEEPFTVTFEDLSQDTGVVSQVWIVNGVEFTDSVLVVDIDGDVTVIRQVEFSNGCTASKTFNYDLDDFDIDLSIGNNYTGDTISPTSVTFFPVISGGDAFGTPVYTWVYDSGSGPMSFVGDSLTLTLDLDQSVDLMLTASFDNGCEVTAEDLFRAQDCDRDPEVAIDINCDDLSMIEITLRDTTLLDSGIILVERTWTVNGVESNDSILNLTLTDEIIDVSLEVLYSDSCRGTFNMTFDPDDFIPEIDYNVELIECVNGFGTFLFTDDSDYHDCLEVESMTWIIDGDTYSGDSILVDIRLGRTVDVEYIVTFTNGSSFSTMDDTDPTNDILDTEDFFERVDFEIMNNGPVFCEIGDSIELEIINPDTNLIYSWSFDSEFSNIIGTGTTLITVTDENFNGVVFAQAINDSLCMYGQESIDIDDFGIDLSFDMPFEICPGDTAVFEVINNNVTQTLTYEWKGDGSIFIEGDSTSSPTIGIPEDHQGDFFFVLCTENQFGCTSVDTIHFAVSENEDLNPFSFDLDSCGGLTINFTANNPFDGNLHWDFGDGNSANEENPSHTYGAPGTYLVTLSDSSMICPGNSYSDSITVPDFIEITISPDTLEYSIGDTLTITATTNGDPDDAVWIDEEGNVIFTGNPLIYAPTDSIEEICVTITDEFNCSDTACIILILRDDCPEDLMIVGPDEVCPNDTFELQLVMDQDPALFTYLWDPDECIVSGGNTNNPTVTVESSKTFSVLVMREGICEDTIVSLDVTVDLPEINIATESGEDFICLGEEAVLLVVPDDPDCDYTWSTGETGPQITVEPEVDTEYIVTCVDDLGCEISDTFLLEVRQPQCIEDEVFVPDAFSPNGDGNNDVLFVRGKFIEGMEFYIINRWGEEVFRTTDPQQGWDGTYMGEDLHPDAFAYGLEVFCIGGGSFKKTGNVSIIK